MPSFATWHRVTACAVPPPLQLEKLGTTCFPVYSTTSNKNSTHRLGTCSVPCRLVFLISS